MGIKNFFRGGKSCLGNLLAMILVVCAIVWGVFKWLDIYTEHNISVTVPDIKGMHLNEARTLLGNHTLVAVISDSTYNTNQPAGIILDTNPVAGSIVKERRTIYLTINTNRAPMKVIPDIIDNSSLREAEAKLMAMGFKLTDNEPVEGEKDWIYGIKYRGAEIENGDEVTVGAVLTLKVGTGE